MQNWRAAGDPLDHYCFPLSLLISYPVLLSQLDWLFSCGTRMMEPWWVRAPALPLLQRFVLDTVCKSHYKSPTQE